MDDLLHRIRRDVIEMKKRYGLKHDAGTSLYRVLYKDKIIGRYKGIETTVELLIDAEENDKKESQG